MPHLVDSLDGVFFFFEPFWYSRQSVENMKYENARVSQLPQVDSGRKLSQQL